jgi:hypothetical protein
MQAEIARSEKKRPLLALQNLEAANAQIDAVVQGARMPRPRPSSCGPSGCGSRGGFGGSGGGFGGGFGPGSFGGGGTRSRRGGGRF